jgi:hypothetical protein
MIIGQPGRHEPATDNFFNEGRTFIYIVIGDQIKRSSSPWPVTARTLLVNEGLNIFIESEFLCSGLVTQKKYNRKEKTKSPHVKRYLKNKDKKKKGGNHATLFPNPNYRYVEL